MKQTIHALLLFATIISFSSTTAQTLYGLTADNHMFSIADAANPSAAINLAEVTGLGEGDQLLAIDMQPATGLLYGLAYNEQEDVAALYNIGIKGPGYIAVPVNTSISLQLGSTRNPGFDFNPVNSSELFITTTNGNVYIVDAASGNILFTGGSIFYAQSDINSGNTPMISGVVHTNSFRGADNTAQFGYDIGNNVLVQFDPNVNATIHTIGLSGLSPDKSSPVGMDSYFDSSSFSNIIFMAVKSPEGKAYSLVYLDPGTGLATHIGNMPPAVQVRDIAADVYIPVPATVQGQLITGL
ncbi:MAG: hypothetical protein K0R82_3068, partial [Flavipsychrobacter sp.]|nr:hypothetical protein [Flavipsychrobacter sp.]